MPLNLKKLEKQLDEALARETKESVSQWLSQKHHNSSKLDQVYSELIQEALNEQPGIFELLLLYGQFQEGFQQSQEYLQLQRPFVYNSTSNISSPST